MNKHKSKALAPAIDMFRKWTFKMLWRPPMLRVSSVESVENMFFMFRFWSRNTLAIASRKALAVFELLSETRHKNLSHRLFVMDLTYFISILSSDVSDKLVDSSAPRVNSLGKDSSMAMLVWVCLLIANCNSSNMVANKYVAFFMLLFLSDTWGHFLQDLQQQLLLKLAH